MPELPVDVDYDDGQGSRLDQLLAVYEVRRRVERLAPFRPAPWTLPMAVERVQVKRRVKGVRRGAKTRVASRRRREVRSTRPDVEQQIAVAKQTTVAPGVRASEEMLADTEAAQESREAACYPCDAAIYWLMRRRRPGAVW